MYEINIPEEVEFANTEENICTICCGDHLGSSCMRNE